MAEHATSDASSAFPATTATPPHLARETSERSAADRVWDAAQLRRVLDGMTEGFGLMAPDFTILEFNAEALRMENRSREEIIGRTHWQVYPGSEETEIGRLYKKAMAERVPVALEHRYLWQDGSTRWLDMRAFPTPDGNLAVFWRDISDRKNAEIETLRSEERLKVMVRELHHRTRNLMAIVQSIVNQTLKSASNLDACKQMIGNRLQALSTVQDLLSREDPAPISLDALVNAELDALAAHAFRDRIEVTGPRIVLKNSAIQILALALHELATNARKHGFLTQAGGRLRVQWEICERRDGEAILKLEWLETGVPRADEGRQLDGYGRKLIERALPYTLDGKADYRLTQDGVACVMELPVSKLAAR